MMKQDKKKIKTKYLWLGFVVCLGLSIAIIFWVTKAAKTNIPLIFLVITFLMMTIFLQMAIARSFRYKPRPRKYKEASYNLDNFDLLEKRLLDNNFQMKKAKFGFGFIKLDGKIAYKVVIIKDSSKYFNQQEDEQATQAPTKGIDKCERFIGFEIFAEDIEDVKIKTPDFSFQGKNVFYEGFYYDEGKKMLIEPNKQTPNDEHLDAYQHLLAVLQLEKNEIQ